jgi:hypothetical protein
LFRFDRRSIRRERSSATDGCCDGIINRTHWSLSLSLSLYDCLAKCSDLYVLQSFPTNRNVKNSFLVEIWIYWISSTKCIW